MVLKNILEKTFLTTKKNSGPVAVITAFIENFYPNWTFRPFYDELPLFQRIPHTTSFMHQC